MCLDPVAVATEDLRDLASPQQADLATRRPRCFSEQLDQQFGCARDGHRCASVAKSEIQTPYDLRRSDGRSGRGHVGPTNRQARRARCQTPRGRSPEHRQPGCLRSRLERRLTRHRAPQLLVGRGWLFKAGGQRIVRLGLVGVDDRGARMRSSSGRDGESDARCANVADSSLTASITSGNPASAAQLLLGLRARGGHRHHARASPLGNSTCCCGARRLDQALSSSPGFNAPVSGGGSSSTSASNAAP